MSKFENKIGAVRKVLEDKNVAAALDYFRGKAKSLELSDPFLNLAHITGNAMTTVVCYVDLIQDALAKNMGMDVGGVQKNYTELLKLLKILNTRMREPLQTAEAACTNDASAQGHLEVLRHIQRSALQWANELKGISPPSNKKMPTP